MPEAATWKIIIHRRAEKALYRLPRDVLQKIRIAIHNLAINPRPEGCKKLVGYDDLYRLRIGDWRIAYAIEEDRLVILIVEIAPRGGAYRNLEK